jgi:ribosomal protein S18 acetylase RimI-like enzyme
MKIVQLEVGDEARLRTIRLRALRDAPDAFLTTLEDASQWTRSGWTSQLQGLHTLVAVQDDCDVGMVRGFVDFKTNPCAAWLISMWVAPHVRRQGVGVALISSLVDWARQEYAVQLHLEVGAHNVAAQALYKRLGFVYSGRSRKQPHPRDHIEELEFVLSLSQLPPSSSEDLS